MDKQVKQIIIERKLYADEVGITHGFFSAKIIYADKTVGMAPFDSVEDAMFAVKHHLFGVRHLIDPFPDPKIAEKIPDHVNCHCLLISDKNAEETS